MRASSADRSEATTLSWPSNSNKVLYSSVILIAFRTSMEMSVISLGIVRRRSLPERGVSSCDGRVQYSNDHRKAFDLTNVKHERIELDSCLSP
jgi:hypothetical protein